MNYADLPSKLLDVRERVGRVCARNGRDPDEVTIVAVTKTHPADAVLAARDAGLADVAENRVQELEDKIGRVGRAGLRWHLIGHLQRNKARRAIELADVIHSIDSIRIATRLSEEASAAGRVVTGLIQVNVSGEETKGGVVEAGAIDEIARICELPSLRIEGLMTMAPFTEDVRAIRSVFARTRRLSEEASSVVPSFRGEHLSMGMSSDFEIAVEEGSTLIRLGTVLLGERSR